jgi:hypothetical protein
MLDNAIRIVKEGLTDEELSIINAFKSMGFSVRFIYFLYQYFSHNKNFKFSNFEEFSKIHSEIKKDSQQRTYDILKNDNLKKDFNFFEHNVYEDEFIRYSKGVKFFSTIVTSLLSSQLLGLSAIHMLEKLFSDAVVGSEGIFTKNFHSSVQEKTIYETKERVKGSYSLEIIYFNIKIITTVDKGFLMDSSKCKIEYTLKSKEFQSINEYLAWCL